MRSLEVHSRAPTLDWVRETSGRNWTLKPRSKENDKYIGRKKEGKVPSREMAWAKTGGKRQVKEVAPFKEPREVHRCPVLSSSLSLEPPASHLLSQPVGWLPESLSQRGFCSMNAYKLVQIRTTLAVQD